MTRDAQASLRMPQDLKDEVKKIAEIEHRTLSNTIELLLRNAVVAYWKEKRPLIEVSSNAARIDGAQPIASKQSKTG